MTLTADQLRGRVRVLIDGEDQYLRFDQGALARLIENLSLESLADIPGAVTSLDPGVLRVLVWAGLSSSKPDLKLEDCDGWFYPLMPTYHSAVEAINLALWGVPSPEEIHGGSEDDADPPSEQDGTG